MVKERVELSVPERVTTSTFGPQESREIKKFVGLGNLVAQWGQRKSIPHLAVNQFVTIKEGTGILSAKPISFTPPTLPASARQ